MVEASCDSVGRGLIPAQLSSIPIRPNTISASLACVDVLGRTPLERAVDRFIEAGIECISILVESDLADLVPPGFSYREALEITVFDDVRSALSDQLACFAEKGITHAFVSSASTYTETDVLDLSYFHRESKRLVTRAFNHDGPLDLWVVDCAKAQDFAIESLLEADGNRSRYFVREYVRRLTHPRHLRQFTEDALRGVCQSRPVGRDTRPGVWVGDDAEIHPSVRIVAPAYIGSRSIVKEDTLITRFSSIEKDCFIDFGTVIENSSVLEKTHIGIWLDVCHAIVKANIIFSLDREVTVEISDACIIRSAFRGVGFNANKNAAARLFSTNNPNELRIHESANAGATLSRE
jgi:NDP-sugar pyrophosphorylase family protein